MYELFAGLGLDLPLRYTLALADDRPVATSSLFLGAGVAGVQFVATLPEGRGQGIDTAMTMVPLRDAQEFRYCVGVLQSSNSGLGVCRRLGFRQQCSVGHRFWPRDGHQP